MTRFASFIAFVCVALMCRASASDPPPAGWIKTDFGGFHMCLPPEITKQPVRGIDSAVSFYSSKSIRISTDYGHYSGGGHPTRYEQYPDFTSTIVTIAGKKADLYTINGTQQNWTPQSGYLIGVSFLDPVHGTECLEIFASCDDKKDYETLKRIFATIQFK